MPTAARAIDRRLTLHPDLARRLGHRAVDALVERLVQLPDLPVAEPGGRVQTARDGFRRGGHAELGAIRIFESHEYTLTYVREFGLELTPYDTGAQAFHMQGKRFLPPPGGRPWPLDGLAAGEQPDPAARFGDYLGSGFAKLGDVFDPGWPGAFQSALEFAGHGHRRVAATRRLFQRVLPGIRGQIVGVAHKAWQEDPWAGGGWGLTQPGELAWMLPAMRQVEGRVHFAGEHTSLWIAWMNGALESAERVVAEILRADGQPRKTAGLVAATA